MDYANKVVAITGGARGIGLAMAQAFHTRGARTVSYTHLTLPTKA